MKARVIIARAIRGLPKVPPRRARAALAWLTQNGKRPNRMRALAAIGSARGYKLPASRDRLELQIVGAIGHPGQAKARELDPLDIEMRIAANPDVSFIDVEINSVGGSVRGAQQIFNALRAHPAYVCATVDGCCASAAIQVLLAADWREAMCDSSILLHAVEIAPRAKRRWTAQRHRQLARLCEETDEFLISQCAARTGHARSIFAREFSDERGISLTRAISCGLLHAMVGETTWRDGRPYAWPPESVFA